MGWYHKSMGASIDEFNPYSPRNSRQVTYIALGDTCLAWGFMSPPNASLINSYTDSGGNIARNMQSLIGNAKNGINGVTEATNLLTGGIGALFGNTSEFTTNLNKYREKVNSLNSFDIKLTGVINKRFDGFSSSVNLQVDTIFLNEDLTESSSKFKDSVSNYIRCLSAKWKNGIGDGISSTLGTGTENEDTKSIINTLNDLGSAIGGIFYTPNGYVPDNTSEIKNVKDDKNTTFSIYSPYGNFHGLLANQSSVEVSDTLSSINGLPLYIIISTSFEYKKITDSDYIINGLLGE